MYSIGFPNIFNGSTVYLNKDYDAIKTNLKLLLGSNRGGLFGDPYYGTKLKTVLWDQAHDDIILELLKDDVFEAIYSYMPQITVKKDDITVTKQNNFVNVTIKVTSDSGVESNLYEITLLTNDSE